MNNRVECNYGRLKAEAGADARLETDRTATVIIEGHGFIQDLRRGHCQLGVEATADHLRCATAFDELVSTVLPDRHPDRASTRHPDRTTPQRHPSMLVLQCSDERPPAPDAGIEIQRMIGRIIDELTAAAPGPYVVRGVGLVRPRRARAHLGAVKCAHVRTTGILMRDSPLDQAIQSTKAVLAGVEPGQLNAATPCASWKVSELINHIVGGQSFFATVASGESMSNDAPPDFSAGDFRSSFENGAAACLAAFGADGAMERIMHLPFGDMPGAAFVGIAATDTFIHGWDLARATGQNTDLAPELAAGLLAGIQSAIPEAFRGPDGKAPFGAVQAAPAGASNADQLAAFLGRTV